MQTQVWAVFTTSRDVSGKVSQYVELRLQKTPHLGIVYQSCQVESFGAARKWAESKGVELRYARQFNRWNDTAKIFEYGKVVELKAPDEMGNRGGAICEVCGGKTRQVLDGEAWCDPCERYQ